MVDQTAGTLSSIFSYDSTLFIYFCLYMPANFIVTPSSPAEKPQEFGRNEYIKWTQQGHFLNLYCIRRKLDWRGSEEKLRSCFWLGQQQQTPTDLAVVCHSHSWDMSVNPTVRLERAGEHLAWPGRTVNPTAGASDTVDSMPWKQSHIKDWGATEVGDPLPGDAWTDLKL